MELDCVWSSTPPANSSSPSSSAVTGPVYTLGRTPATPDSELLTLELMHHYTNCASQTLSAHSVQASEVWKSVVPHLAFSTKSQFLIDSILAFSALHLCFVHSQDPSATQYAGAAAIHHQKSIKALLALSLNEKPLVADSQGTFFVTHILMAVYGFATADCVFDPSDWLQIMRCQANPSSWDEYTHGALGPLSGLFDSDHSQVLLELATCTTPSFPTSLSVIHSPTSGAPDPDEVRDEATSKIYEDAVSVLKLSWVASLNPHSHIYAAGAWPCFAPHAFNRLLSERRPRALIVTAHYCATMHRMATTGSPPWWARRHWDAEIKLLYNLLDSRWHRWLREMSDDTFDQVTSDLTQIILPMMNNQFLINF